MSGQATRSGLESGFSDGGRRLALLFTCERYAPGPSLNNRVRLLEASVKDFCVCAKVLLAGFLCDPCAFIAQLMVALMPRFPARGPGWQAIMLAPVSLQGEAVRLNFLTGQASAPARHRRRRDWPCKRAACSQAFKRAQAGSGARLAGWWQA